MVREWAPVFAAATIAVVAVLTFRRLKKTDTKEALAAAKKEGEWKGRMDAFKKNTTKRLKGIDKKIGGIDKKVGVIEATVLQIEAWFQRAGISKVNSPLTLNELAERAWRELDAEDWLEQHAAEVSDKVTDMGEYDVQEFCFAHMATLELEPQRQRRLRNIAFHNGLTEFQVRQILAIKLRDQLLDLAGLDRPTDEKELPSPLPGPWDEPQQRRGGQ